MNADIQKYAWTPVMRLSKAGRWTNTTTMLDANESITDKQPDELPNLNQIILVYCCSGRRSKEASQKLADIGYTNVYEFGGINTWTGEIVK